MARRVADRLHVADRAVAVLRISQHKLARRFELVVQLLVRVPAASPALDGTVSSWPALATRGEGAVSARSTEPHVAADEREVGAAPRASQRILAAVADADGRQCEDADS